MIGIHTHKGKHNTLEDAVNHNIKTLGITVTQVYTHGPRSYNKINLGNMNNISIPVYIHATHFTHIFNNNVASINHLRQQLKTCAQIQGEGVVIHLQKVPMNKTISVINQLLPHMYGQKIILESPAMIAEDNSYETPDKINNLIDNLRKITTPDVVGICIDTSHQTAGGINLRTYDGTRKFFKQIKHKEFISLIHLNGTSYDLGSGKDCHEVIFSKSDKIWNSYKLRPHKSGVAYITKLCKRKNIPIILEVNREANEGDMVFAMEELRKLYA